MSFYLSVDVIGNDIIERFINNHGTEEVRRIPYEPTMFIHCNDETKYKDIYGKYCLPKRFSSINDCRQWQQKTKGVVEVLGMDDFKLAYISDTYKGEIEYDKSKIRVVNFDIEVTGKDFPKPNVAEYEIDAITHYDSVDDRYYVFDLLNSMYANVSKWCPTKAALPESEGGDNIPQHILDKVVYMTFDKEKDLLLALIQLWREKPPAVLTGWNIEGFDIPYIMNRIKNVLGPTHVKLMSPFGKVTSKVITGKFGDEQEVFTIRGISVLDYLDLYKKFSFTNQPSYKLDFIAEAEVGMNKMSYDGPINKLRETDHQRYISYNIIDVYCVKEIDVKRGFIDLALSMGYYAKMNIESVMSPIKTWDAIIFNSAKEDNVVIPEIKHHIKESYPGAKVLEPESGAYPYIMSFDLTSLYPSIIRQVGISPETIVGQFKSYPIEDYINRSAPKPSEEYSCSPNGWMYDKVKEGIIPREIAKVFFQRKAWKGKMLPSKRNAELIEKMLQKFKKD